MARDALGKKEEAVASYREAVRLKPTEATYRLNLGAALRRTGDVEGALGAFKDATRLAPRDAMAWANLGMVLSDKKSYDEAHAALDKATKLKPDFALAWNRLGRVALKRGQPRMRSRPRRRPASWSRRTAPSPPISVARCSSRERRRARSPSAGPPWSSIPRTRSPTTSS